MPLLSLSILLFTLVQLAFPQLAMADAGIPTVFVSIPLMLIAFVPIVAIETYLIHKSCGGDLKKVLKAICIANLWSTLIGMPIAAILQLAAGIPAIKLIDLFTTGRAKESLETVVTLGIFLGGASTGASPHTWAFPMAMGVMTLFFLLVSWPVEYIVLKRKLGIASSKQFSRLVLLANVASYAFITAVWVSFAIREWL